METPKPTSHHQKLEILVGHWRGTETMLTTFEGHGVMTYDSNEARYVLHWFDSMGSPPEVFTGTFEGDVLTVGHGGPGMHARLTYDLTRKGVLRSRMDLSEDGADWAGFFECDYERDS
jgi:uncharacterized protein YodC (DUF2158 family)